MRILSLILCLALTLNCTVQDDFLKTDFVAEYDSIVNSKDRTTNNSLLQIREFAKSGNPNWFLRIGYFINANNIMFRATNDSKYLKYNSEIILEIDKQGTKLEKGRKWVAKVAASDQNRSMNNQEFMLYEGYLMRYVAEFAYIIKSFGLEKQFPQYSNFVAFAEDNFNKWRDRSIGGFKDESLLFGIRTHMGAQWATTATYLSLLVQNPVRKVLYATIYQKYNVRLRRNFKTERVDGAKYYVWNSSWNRVFSNQQRQRQAKIGKENEIQDVAHGNHVVQYIIDSYELGIPFWSNQDLQLLANTVKLKTWNKTDNSFWDTVDGRTSNDSTLVNTGWRQSDGWMKLMLYDHDLFSIYKDFYIKSDEAKKSYLNTQFIANFEYYKSKVQK
jgi:hypothetical protein